LDEVINAPRPLVITFETNPKNGGGEGGEKSERVEHTEWVSKSGSQSGGGD
jgi:hypothetical protein